MERELWIKKIHCVLSPIQFQLLWFLGQIDRQPACYQITQFNVFLFTLQAEKTFSCLTGYIPPKLKVTMLAISWVKRTCALDADVFKGDKGERGTKDAQRKISLTTRQWDEHENTKKARKYEPVFTKKSAGRAHSGAAIAYISVTLSETKIFL